MLFLQICILHPELNFWGHDYSIFNDLFQYVLLILRYYHISVDIKNIYILSSEIKPREKLSINLLMAVEKDFKPQLYYTLLNFFSKLVKIYSSLFNLIYFIFMIQANAKAIAIPFLFGF
jgi:hypothetical protein